MIELIIAAICVVILALVLFVRVFKGPTMADRAVAADSIEILVSGALMLYALYSGRSIYLDVALVVALLGYISTVLIARYLEGRL